MEVQAQSIVPDSSLNTAVTSSNGRDFVITNGTAANSNLFHSFRDFSIPTSGSATFDLVNTPNVRTIFNRVTGSAISNIDGVIQTANGSNRVSVFLLNQNGVVFGSNAQLNLGGSFVATTANSIQFADGASFGAASPPLLTISAPIGLQFSQSSASINVQGTGHQLTAANPVFAPYVPSPSQIGLAASSIALIGNSVRFNNGVVIAPEGRIEIGGVDQGFVGLTAPEFNYDRVSSFGDVSLTGRSLIDASGVNSGSVQVVGRNVTLGGGSAIWVQNRGTQTGGNINIAASESLKVTGTTPNVSIRSSIVNETVGSGANGTIRVAAPNVSVAAGGAISSRNYGSSIGGTVTVNAGQLNVDGFAPISPDFFSVLGTLSFSTGNAGNLNVAAQKISVQSGGYLGTTTIGTGNSGNAIVNADDIFVAGITPTFVSSVIAANTAGLGGDGGNLTLNTQRLTLREGGLVAVSSVGRGSAGNLTVNASEFVDVADRVSGSYSSAIASTVDFPNASLQRIFGIPAQPQGNSGDVVINTPILRLRDTGTVASLNRGIGNAGAIRVNAKSIFISRTDGIIAFTLAGEGGNIEIQSDLLMLRRKGIISATAQGQGNAGSIRLTVPVILGLENSDIIANAIDGRGGNISITTQALLGLKYRDRLTSESDITASSQFGINGTVQISSPAINPNAGLIELSTSLIEPNQRIANGCATGQSDRFVITGRGGVPTNPTEQVYAERSWADVRDFSALQGSIAPLTKQSATSPDLVVEATTWYRNSEGSVVLAAGQPIHSSIATCAISE